MNWLVAAIALCALVSTISASRGSRASGAIAWCYNEPSCNDTTWSTIATEYCNGSRQSPIDIESGSATGDASLGPFTFYNFSSTKALTKIENTGKTVKVTLAAGVGISGGGLSEKYDSLQFHFHWGNGSSVPGSEHTVDGKRYAMECHIVSLKASHNGNTSAGLADPLGFAALGFFIEAMSGDETGQPASWQKLSSYLSRITNSGTEAAIESGISLDDLFSGVDKTSYYRYLGSLTTPACNEAVIWTVFKQPVKVSKDIIDSFSQTVRVGNSSTPFAVKTFRNVQPKLPVTTQATGSASSSCYSLGLLALSLFMGRS